MHPNPPLLALEQVHYSYPTQTGFWERIQRRSPASQHTSILKSIHLTIAPNEIVGLVGESGCGKSTIARLITQHLQPTSGQILFEGQPLSHLDSTEKNRFRLAVQMIFQDPSASLNPKIRIGKSIAEAPLWHGLTSQETVHQYVAHYMELVGLHPRFAERYPHELSGGQKQRVSIARALALQPRILVCDEIVSALDVSVSAQVLNVLQQLKQEQQLSYLFISHDLSVIRYLCDRIYVMYLGQIVESGSVESLFTSASHPYTRALIAHIPDIHARKVQFQALEGELPSPLNPPSGCAFHPRCPQATELCSSQAPTLQPFRKDHWVACHFATPSFL